MSAVVPIGREPGGELVSPAVLEPCLKTGKLDSIAALNKFVGSVRGSDAFAGGDVGASVQLQDGRSVFVFGDTLRSKAFVGQQFVRNSMLIFSPGCGQVVLPADGGALIPDRPDGVGYWPMSIARVEHKGYDVVGMGLQRIRSTDAGGVFAFESLGPAFATLIVPRGGTPRVRSLKDIGADNSRTEKPMWGAAAVVSNGWVYLYGTSRPSAATMNGFALRVARSRVEDLGTPDRWQYWDSRRWQPEATRATILIPSVGGVSQTLSVFPRNGSWYVVSKRDEVLGKDLTIWVGRSPSGPFTESRTVARIPSDAVSGTLRYMPLAHPDLLPADGTVVVSYSVNNTDFALVQDDPRRYRPRFLRVSLPTK